MYRWDSIGYWLSHELRRVPRVRGRGLEGDVLSQGINALLWEKGCSEV